MCKIAEKRSLQKSDFDCGKNVFALFVAIVEIRTHCRLHKGLVGFWRGFFNQKRCRRKLGSPNFRSYSITNITSLFFTLNFYFFIKFRFDKNYCLLKTKPTNTSKICAILLKILCKFQLICIKILSVTCNALLPIKSAD